MVDQKIMSYNNSNNYESIFENVTDDYVYEKPQIYIDYVLNLRNEGILTNDEVREHVHMMIFAGHDTSGYAASMSILMLAMHPNVQQCVVDELYRVLGDQPVDDDLKMDQINKLDYFEQVIKETFRLFPVIPVLLRNCTEDTQLPNFVIPKGTDVFISILTAQRRKDIWGEDADEFNLDHFSKNTMLNRSPYAYMIFGNGTRNCLGQ